jgi:hypothetical protein
MIEGQLRQGRVENSMAAKKPQKKKRGRSTAAAASTSSSFPATLFRSVIDMTATAVSSGSVLLCLFAAKRLF